jgi:hypothetical protein
VIRITRSQPAPESLAEQKGLASGKYNCGDVVDRLKADFKNKCYLCKESSISAIEVDHLQPHGENCDLKFDWNNLFFSCQHCNGTKWTTWPVLDCTDHSLPVLSLLRYIFRVSGDLRAEVVVEATSGDAATVNTAHVLSQIFDGRTPTRAVEAVNILEKVQVQCRSFFRIVTYLAAGKGSDDERSEWCDRISRELAPERSFVAVRAWEVIRHEELASRFRQELERLGYVFE